MLHRVMLIDDNDSDLLFGRLMLERSGVAQEVLCFEAAQQALAWLGQPEPQALDLILLDINMPGMNGFEFLQAYEHLRAERRSSAVVVMLTSSPDPDDHARALSFASVRGYVTKPLSRDSAAGLVRYVDGGAA